MNERASAEKIEEALRILEEAAREEKDGLKTILADKYGNLKELFMGAEQQLVDILAQTRSRAYSAAQRARDYSLAKVKDVDANAHNNPWPYVGGAAVIGLLAGYIFGRNGNR